MLTISHLRKVQQQLTQKYAATIAETFALRWLETEHGVPHERALNQVAFQVSQQLGVHGFHLDESRKTLILLICNPSRFVSDFAESLDRFCAHGIPSLFADTLDSIAALFDPPPPDVATAGRFVHQFQSLVEESRSVITTVSMRLVFFGDSAAAGSATIVRNFHEKVVHLRPVIDAVVAGAEVTSTVKSADGSSTVPDKLKGYRHTIDMANHVETSGPDCQRISIGTVSLWQLLQIYRKLGTRFLARNVRAGLTVATGSNQALRKAFREVASGSSAPAYFLFRHNGITLTAATCRRTDDGLELVEPQLLNGAQTVTTLDAVCEELSAKKQLDRVTEDRLSKLFVLGRVISSADHDFITSVTIANNRQNPIMPWHLRAHDDIQSLLQSWFLDRLGLYYEVQEKAFDSMSEDELESHGVLETDKCLEIKKLAQTFLATEGLIDKMQQLKKVFEEDSVYGRAFHPGRVKADPEDVVFCYKIDRRIRKMLTVLGGRGKYAFVKSARNLIWALLCQAYLNSKQRECLATNHGRNLVATEEFTEILERLASTRIKPLLTWIANESEYAQHVSTERYAFVATQKAFDLAMQEGRDRWGWQHRRLGSA